MNKDEFVAALRARSDFSREACEFFASRAEGRLSPGLAEGVARLWDEAPPHVFLREVVAAVPGAGSYKLLEWARTQLYWALSAANKEKIGERLARLGVSYKILTHTILYKKISPSP